MSDQTPNIVARLRDLARHLNVPNHLDDTVCFHHQPAQFNRAAVLAAADEIDRLRAFVSDLAAQNESTVGLWEWQFFIGRAREATKGVS